MQFQMLPCEKIPFFIVFPHSNVISIYLFTLYTNIYNQTVGKKVLKRGQFVSVGRSSRCASLLLSPPARSPILLTAHGPKPSEEQVRAYLAAGTGPLYLGPPLPAPRAFLITARIPEKKDYPSPVGRGKVCTDRLDELRSVA
jgi:hypothetical protein